MKTVHLLISGRVQGVFFRATAQKIARQYHITGWVKNTSEGNVETVATGEEENLKYFSNWCREGPEQARVINVTVSEAPIQNFPDFRIIH